MATYVISDIHGCYNEFMDLIEMIDFSDDDELILLGDYIDRGPDSLKVVDWLMHCPDNVLALRGNHEEEFIALVGLIESWCSPRKMNRRIYCGAASAYEVMKNVSDATGSHFDAYGTLYDLIHNYYFSVENLLEWSKFFNSMPYLYKKKIKGKQYIFVHAGYAEDFTVFQHQYYPRERFYLYAGEDGYKYGGIPYGTIIAGHTPTIDQDRFAYNNGQIYRYYNRTLDCTYYDIDCGCVFRDEEVKGKLACLRIEDKKVFYR